MTPNSLRNLVLTLQKDLHRALNAIRCPSVGAAGLSIGAAE